MEVRGHVELTDRELSKSHYFSRWFSCQNARCVVAQVYPSRFIVENSREVRDAAGDRLLTERASRTIDRHRHG